MPVLPRIESALDRAIGVFSPARECRRRVARAAAASLRSATYAAAQSPRTIGDWAPVDAGVNSVIAASAVSVRARVRQLVRDFPYFARAINILTDYTVGPGIVFQSRIHDRGGKLDRKACALVEDALARWGDEADAAGRLHLYEMMALAKRQEIECGEFILVTSNPRDRNRYLPLALQMYEPDWLTSQGAVAGAKTSKIHEGIEYDTGTGRTLAYHFTDPDGWGKTVRIEADRVIHGFKTLRPGQLRGISDFTPGVLVARDLSTYMDTEIDTAKLAAKYLAFVTTPDILGRQAGTSVNSAGQRTDAMENAIIEYLRPGEEINIASNPRPGDNFPPMVKLILTMLAVTTGCPYELLSGNYEGMNYSVGKMVRNDFRQLLRPTVGRHVRHFCEPVKRSFFDAAALSGRLPFRAYFTDPVPWQRGEWQPPGMESIDPARETKSMIDQTKTGLRSPQEIVKSRGRDLEEVYLEIKQAQDLAAELGLTFDVSTVSTALANNPAAIEAQTKKGEPSDA